MKEVRNNFYSGPFVNADEIEESFKEKGLLNAAADFSVEFEEKDFANYLNGEGNSWIDKAKNEGNSIILEVKENILLVKGIPNPYDAALAADFIRHELLKKGCYFFDNSSERKSIEPVAVIHSDASLEIKVEDLPWWVEEYIVNTLYK